MKRKAFSKKDRFEVFKRDGFTCQYCGRKVPDTVLEVDHVIPVKENGGDGMDNLVTSCQDCNRGKSARLLTSLPPSLAFKTEDLKERKKQMLAYADYLKTQEYMMSCQISQIEVIYSDCFKGWELTEGFKQRSLISFIKRLPLEEVQDAMRIACSKFRFQEQRAIKYFCGICWRKIRENDAKSSN